VVVAAAAPLTGVLFFFVFWSGRCPLLDSLSPGPPLTTNPIVVVLFVSVIPYALYSYPPDLLVSPVTSDMTPVATVFLVCHLS